MNLSAAKAKVNAFFQTYGGNANPQLLRSGKGKVYELYCLAKTIEFLKACPAVSIRFVGTRVDFKSSPGKVDKTKSYFVITRNGLDRELHTNIEVRTLSSAHGFGVTGPSSYHEIDLVLLEDARNGERPEHLQVVLGVECKSDAIFKKEIVRHVLGVRRELSLFRLAPSKLHALLCGLSREIVANPASEYWLAFTDPRGAAYRSGPAVFEIEFKHWCPGFGASRHDLAFHPPGEFTKEQSTPLVERSDLLNRFGALLGTSTHVDIAVAWVGPGLAVERLAEHARRVKTRIAVGLSGNSTEPATLRRLMAIENVELRVARPPRRGVFHPKFYRFCGEQGTICWIGSANFTRGGFGGNTELVHEFKDRLDVGGEWFECLWKDLDDDPEPAIACYEAHYRPPKPLRHRGDGPASLVRLPRLEEIETWREFVAALHVLDDYCHRRQFEWDVLGETYSYLHTISVGSEVARRSNWQNFSRRDRNILLGLDHWDDTGAWGLLGNLRGAGKAVGVFTPPGNPELRSYVLEKIHDVIGATGAGIVESSQRAVAEIMQPNRFGPAVATRILALACPGWLVSVNGPSAIGLGEFADMERKEEYLATNYGELLEKIYARQWWQAPEPVNPSDREIWRCRAALVDAFVYIPCHEV